MKLGMFMMPIQPPGCDTRATVREDREAVLLADRPSWSEADVGEHVEDAALAQRSMQLMAEEVMPRRNAAIGQA